MEHFDGVVSDPSVRKADVMKYFSNLDNIGKPFMGKCTFCRSRHDEKAGGNSA